MSTPNPVPTVRAVEPEPDVPGPEPTPAVLEPEPEAAVADVISGAEEPDPIPLAPDPIPPEASPGPPEAAVDTAPKPPGDVIVFETRRLKQWFGAFIGALIGVMLMGAIVVPVFQDRLLVLGIVAGIATVVALAWLGMRIAARPARDP